VVATARVRVLVAGAAVVVAGVGAVAWSRAVSGSEEPDVVLDEPGNYVLPGLVTNPPFANGDLPDVGLLDAAGQEVRLVPDGRPMVVNLWYSTCPPCARELADFAAADAELGADIRFVGVNPVDSPDVMNRFAGDRGVVYELLRDPDGRFGEGLDVVAYPATLFVDVDGTILDSTGAIDERGLRARIAELWP
jgi:thiol-disulfide isomerase/thioredoxin